MEIPSETFVTDGGYEITYYTDLSFGQAMDMQKEMATGAQITIEDGKSIASGLSSGKAFDAIRKTIECLIVSIKYPDGTDVKDNAVVEFFKLPSKEVNSFKKIALDILASAMGEQKKTIS